jgi:hypothetical protein
MSTITNRGTGAGGAATNINGLPFETLVSNENNLLSMGFQKVQYSKSKGNYYLLKRFDDVPRIVYYAKKKALKYLVDKLLNIPDMFKEPDEAYLTYWLNDNTYELKIIEMKNQNRDGSVEEKLWTAGWIRDVYREVLNNQVEVKYAYTLSTFLKRKLDSNVRKYSILCNLFTREDIKIFHGQDEDYFEQLNTWLGLN